MIGEMVNKSTYPVKHTFTALLQFSAIEDNGK